MTPSCSKSFKGSQKWKSGSPTTDPDVVIEPFPPYAPEINPADGIWRYTKYCRLANYCPPDLFVLRSRITAELNRLKKLPELLKSFIRFTKLPINL
jgi:transposase